MKKDDDQTDLIDWLDTTPARARSSDPKTSHDAAKFVNEGRLREVFETLAIPKFRELGCIKDDVFFYLRAADPTIERDTVSPRFITLREAGLAELRFDPITGKALTRPGKSGKPQQIHWITEKGLEVFRSKK